jgi:hypothetical protein
VEGFVWRELEKREKEVEGEWGGYGEERVRAMFGGSGQDYKAMRASGDESGVRRCEIVSAEDG